MDKNEWVYGYYVACGDKHYIFTGEKGNFPVTAVHRLMYEGFIHLEVIPETVGQFTGLLDMNGKEIYDGDILGGKGKIIGFVKDGVRGYCYDVIYAKPLSNGETRWSLYATVTDDYNGSIEVIGNIHDNHELLTAK
jgi:uncharacterized phage protein (TIGR01671 family)